jgi:hypothetical protein
VPHTHGRQMLEGQSHVLEQVAAALGPAPRVVAAVAPCKAPGLSASGRRIPVANPGGTACWVVLTVYFGTPSMFITLWFGFDYGTNPPLGTLII